MRARAWLAALLLAVASPVASHDVYPTTGGGGSTPNVGTDTNSDGHADYMLVGDYDGDGTLEMADLQAAHNALRVSTFEEATKHALTARTGAACDGGTGNCFIRATGSFPTDGFAVGDEVLVEGFNYYSTGRAVIGVTAGGGCGVGTGGDCFAGTGTPDFTTLFTVGMTVYPFGILEDTQGDPLQFGYTITALDADEIEVSCNGIAAGTAGCLDAETERPGRWLISPGVNGVYTIASIPSATQIKVTETIPKNETSTPTSGGVNAPKIQDTRPITLDLVEGSFAAPAALGTGNARSILETESYTTWRCKSHNTVMNGDGENLDAAVFSGRIPWVAGYTRNVKLENCKVDGGWGAGGATANLAMGLQLQGFLDSEIVGVEVVDTGHTGFYTSNSWNLTMRDFRGRRLGNPRNLGAVGLQAAVYIFATSLGNIDGFTYNVSLIGGEVTDSSTAYNFRRNASTDEIWGPVFRDLAARNMRGLCVFVRGVLRMTIDGMTCDATVGFALDNSAAAWGTDSEVRSSTFRNITITGSVSSASNPFQFGDYHSRNLVENVYIRGSSGTNACVLLQQPQRENVLRNFVVDGCAGDGVQITGTSSDLTRISANEGWTLDNWLIRANDDEDPFATSRYPFQSTVALANTTFRNWRIEGATGNAMLFGASAPCRGCTFENIAVTQMQPRYLGRMTVAQMLAHVEDATIENYFVIVTDGTGATDCATGGGATVNACYTAGTGTWADFTVAGANQDVLNFSGGLEYSVLRNITIRGCRASDGINIALDAIGNTFEGIRIEDTGQWTGISNGCVDGLVSDADAQSANNHLTGLSCVGIAGQCFAWNAGAEPSGAAGSQDDFDASSQFPLAANPGAAVCTTGQTAQTAGTDGFDVCEAAAWVNK